MKTLSDTEWKRRGGWNPLVAVLGSYCGNDVKLLVKCVECGREWRSLPGNLLKGKRCRLCTRKQAAEKIRAARKNKILSSAPDKIVVDISTRAHPNARMLVDAAGWERLKALRSRISGSGKYAVFYRNGRSRLVHRELVPGASYVDHINGDGFDNRYANLRACSAGKNGSHRCRRNRNNTTGAHGVYWRKDTKKWSAQIMVNRKSIALGSYSEKSDAIKARRAAENSLYGDFAPPEILA